MESFFRMQYVLPGCDRWATTVFRVMSAIKNVFADVLEVRPTTQNFKRPFLRYRKNGVYCFNSVFIDIPCSHLLTALVKLYI